jgi:hypothetical protein
MPMPVRPGARPQPDPVARDCVPVQRIAGDGIDTTFSHAPTLERDEPGPVMHRAWPTTGQPFGLRLAECLCFMEQSHARSVRR